MAKITFDVYDTSSLDDPLFKSFILKLESKEYNCYRYSISGAIDYNDMLLLLEYYTNSQNVVFENNTLSYIVDGVKYDSGFEIEGVQNNG